MKYVIESKIRIRDRSELDQKFEETFRLQISRKSITVDDYIYDDADDDI